MTPEPNKIEPTYRGGGGVQGWIPACPPTKNWSVPKFLEWMVTMDQLHYDWREILNRGSDD